MSFKTDAKGTKTLDADIKLIRDILEGLDHLNDQGLSIRVAWVFENSFTLETILPQVCPEIIDKIRERVMAGYDNVNLSAYNGGILPALTKEEFDASIDWAVRNRRKSGVLDLFGTYSPFFRPPAMMFTPSMITELPEHGIKAVALYYSSHPQNAFSNFTLPLSIRECYNPVWLTAPGMPENKIIMMPCYNPGDLAERLGLKKWVISLRKKQLRMKRQEDFCIMIDIDSDTLFNENYASFFIRDFIEKDKMIALVEDLDTLGFIDYTTPWEYANSHTPAGTVAIGQDTAAGSFDGYSNWAEKFSSVKLWKDIEKSRRLCSQIQEKAESVSDPKLKKSMSGYYQLAFENRIKALNADHFGSCSPYVFYERIEQAEFYSKESIRFAENALNQLSSFEDTGLPGGVSVEEFKEDADKRTDLIGIGSDFVQNNSIRIYFSKVKGVIISFTEGNRKIAISPRFSLRYNGRLFSDRGSIEYISEFEGTAQILVRGKVWLASANGTVKWQHLYTIKAGSSAVYVNVDVEYPNTIHKNYKKLKAEHLSTTWDSRWQELMPWEFKLELNKEKYGPYRVWKENGRGFVSYYDIDYEKYTNNHRIDSLNNQVSPVWLAVSDKKNGLMIAQNRTADCSFAFCPMRRIYKRGKDHLYLNPMGVYYGRQLDYVVARTGIARNLDSLNTYYIDSSAPSYNGAITRFSFMLQFYEGDSPTEEMIEDVNIFADKV